MSDAPERIWACVSKNTKSGVVTLLGDATFPVDGWQEYVRADRIEALEAKLAECEARLRKAEAGLLAIAKRDEQMIWGEDYEVEEAFKDMRDISCATLAEIKGESYE